MSKPRPRRLTACVGAAFLAAAILVLSVQAASAGALSLPKGRYLAGAATRSINPEPDGTFAGKPVYLGGYGIGGGSPVLNGRPATGILGDGISVRAFAVSDGQHAFAIADIETQGWFVAVKNGPYGLLDMRKQVEQRTGGALSAEDVVIQSDHSHSGPDPMGVWGGIPDEYMRYIADRTVEAIVDAYSSMRPVRLYYGTAPARDLLSNQFDYDQANEVVDSDVRVLQARGNGPPITLLNFSAHATVLGSSNTKVSGDWVQAANPLLQQRFGGKAVTIVGTLGRTQPADRSCSDPTAVDADAQNLCKIDDYAARVVDRAAQAVANAQPVDGNPIVAARSYFVQDVSSNALILGLEYGGSAAGVPLDRAETPPWLTGAVLGTVTASARIGDVLLSSGPGEMYPQIPLKIAATVPARGYMTAGLANDQLGYLIAPFEAYPEPVRRSFFNQRGDEVSPLDNDNYFFNVSHTMGERVTCSLLRGAGEIFGQGLAYWNQYERCPVFVNDAALPDGEDTQLPSGGTG